MCIAISLMATLSLMGLMKLRKKRVVAAEKQHRFQDIKLRVTQDVLDDLYGEMDTSRNRQDQLRAEIDKITKEMEVLKTTEKEKTEAANTCQSDKVGKRERWQYGQTLSNLSKRKKKPVDI